MPKYVQPRPNTNPELIDEESFDGDEGDDNFYQDEKQRKPKGKKLHRFRHPGDR